VYNYVFALDLNVFRQGKNVRGTLIDLVVTKFVEYELVELIVFE